MAHTARPKLQAAPSGVTPLWGRWEHAFEADDQPPPHTGFAAHFTSPSGREVTVPGFWDGGRTWRVRFMPDEEGTWRYRTTSDPVDTSLNSSQGTLDCRRINTHNRFLRHGPVRVSADGHYLEHADGTPFFFLADTAWNGPMLSQATDWEIYLADRVAKRFSGIQFVTHAPFIATYTNAEGEMAITGHAPLPVNPHFFRRIDARMDAINNKGLLAIPVLAWAATWNEAAIRYNVGCLLPEDQLVAFVRYQVARYQAHHVVWILPGDGVYEGEEAEKWKRVGRAVFAAGPHSIVTLHPAGRHWPYDAFREESWLDIHAYQSSHSDSDETLRWLQSGPPSQAWQTPPVRPVMNIEPCYEDHISGHSGQRFDAYNVRRACYWSLLNAPTAGLTYGAHGIWGWHEKAELPLHHPRSGIGQPWYLAKDLPGSFDIRRLAECFTGLDWWRLRPDTALLANPPRDEDPQQHTMASRSEKGDLAVVYLPAGGETALAMDRLRSGLASEWFNPRSGDRTAAVALAPGRFRAPDAGDWVLIFASSQH